MVFCVGRFDVVFARNGNCDDAVGDGVAAGGWPSEGTKGRAVEIVENIRCRTWSSEHSCNAVGAGLDVNALGESAVGVVAERALRVFLEE